MGLRIGNVELENPYILAPMAGVTDLPFRLQGTRSGTPLYGNGKCSGNPV